MIYALVVAYNKDFGDLIAIDSLIGFKDLIHIIVFDNSEKENNIESKCFEEGIQYISLHKNIGLSRAYNYVIDIINYDENDYLMLCDDDTKFNAEYIQELNRKASQMKPDIVLPVVMSGDLIISPCNIVGKCKVKRIKSVDKINYDKVTAINSGMVVRMGVFNRIKYTEEMFLDYVDHDFMNKVRQFNLKIVVINKQIVQRYSNDIEVSIDYALNRFMIFKNDYRLFCKSLGMEWFYYFYIIYRTIKLTLKYKDLRFFFPRKISNNEPEKPFYR